MLAFTPYILKLRPWTKQSKQTRIKIPFWTSLVQSCQNNYTFNLTIKGLWQTNKIPSKWLTSHLNFKSITILTECWTLLLCDSVSITHLYYITISRFFSLQYSVEKLLFNLLIIDFISLSIILCLYWYFTNAWLNWLGIVF